MRLNKLLVVSLILLTLFSIGAVSAADADSSTLTASDSADVISADNYDTSIYVDAAGSDNNTGSSSSPYASLEKAISSVNASDDAAIYLKAGEYSGDNNTNLIINLAHLNYNGTLTIIGASNGGTIIDGGEEAPIIKSISADSVVTLINITFKNGKSDMGSAIRSSGVLTIDSCTFEDNYATNLAAVYQDSTNNITIKNSKFLNNKANQYADLYYSQNGIITLINNVFDGATAASTWASAPGVAIQTGKSVIKGNTFKNLKSSSSAILYVTYNNGDNIANITDNVFENCTYAGYSGAVLYVQNAYIKNNSFVDSTTSTAWIYANTDINSKVTFDDVNVTGTRFVLTATVTDVDGNLVKNANVYFTVDGKNMGSAKSANNGIASLTVNKLLENGNYTISGTQAYSTNPNVFDVTVLNATATVDFDHNPAEYWVSTTGNDTTGDGSETNPFLTLKHALDVGTAETVDLTVRVKDGLYNGSDNYALSYSNVGKVTIIGESYGNTIIDAEHAKSGYSGAQIFIFGQNLQATLINLTLVNCDSNAVNAYTLTMKDCIVINSTSIRAQSGNDGVLLDNLTVLNGKGQINLYNAEIYNSQFINCNAGTSTGLLWLASNNDYVLRLENNTFYNNTIAGYSGGSAYYIQGNLVSINNTFDSNMVTGTNANYVAYASANKITSINDKFINNNVTNYVIQYRSTGSDPEIIVENITVANNVASGNGAGLSTTGAKIKNGKFINNTAAGNGGAIYLLDHSKTSEVCNMSIEDTVFEDNTASAGNDLFIAHDSANNVFANLSDLTITANNLNVTELSGTLVVSVNHPSGVIIGGGQVKFYLDGNLVGKADLINQNATFEYIGFENNTVYNFTAVYEYATENDTYVSGIVSTNISAALNSVDLYVSNSTGDDSNNGSIKSPFKSISKALTEGYKLSTNITVHVLEGTYTGELNTGLDIPTTIYLTIVGDGVNKTIISDDTADYFLTILAGNKKFTLANMTLNRAARDTQSEIYVEEGANAEINNVEFLAGMGNYGGAINTAGILLINNSYFFDNGYYDISKRANAYYGGAICNDGTLIIDNTTFEGNHAGRLSTIANQGELYMYNSNVIDSIDAYAMNMDLVAIGAFGGQKGNITIVNSVFKVTNRTIDEITGEHVYFMTNSLTCLAIGSSENVVIKDSAFIDEGAKFSPYVFGGINSWNLAMGGYTLVPGDVYVSNTSFTNVQAVNVFYSRTDGTSFHSQRVFEGCLFDNVEYLIAVLNNGNFSISISDSVIMSDNGSKIGFVSGKNISMDISNNWWTSNNATYSNATIGTTNVISTFVLKLREISSEVVNPDCYLILALNATNNTGLLQDIELAFKAFDGENVSDYNGTLYPVNFVISATNGTLAQENGTMDGKVVIPFEGTENSGYYVEANVFNQTVNLTVEDKLVIGNATILAEDITLVYGSTQINVTVLDGDKKANVGKLNLKIDDLEYVADIINGTATFDIDVLPKGNYTLNYNISEDKIFNPVTNSSTLIISPIEPNMTVAYDKSITVGENLTIDVTINEDATGNVTIGNYSGVIENGKASIIISDLAAGNYTVELVYPGDDKYANSVASFNVTVYKISVEFNVTFTSPIYVGEKVIINVTLPSDATGNVSIGNNSFAVEDGFASLFISGLAADNYTVTVVYSGDDKYTDGESTFNVTVNKVPVVFDVNYTSPVEVGEKVIINVTLPSDATGNVSIGNNSFAVEDGFVSLFVAGLDLGNWTVEVVYSGDDKYTGGNVSIPVEIVMRQAILKADDIVMYYKNGTRYVVTLTDNDGTPFANKTVILTINGASYNRTTDENGTASLAINLPAGNYTASALYVGTGNYTNTTIENTVSVLSTIYGDDLVKIFKNDSQYYATFLDGQGNPLANGTTVTFNINGVMYERKTNENGTARLNINLAPGEYILTAIHPDNGEMHSNNITVLSSITDNNDLVKYYKNESQYVATILGADGNAVGAGENVTFNINGVFYTRQTNSSGQVKLNINLAAGNYTITAEYNGCKVSNNIEVLPILSAEDLTKTYGTSDQFVATLVDGTGSPYASQSVQFNINGVFYSRTTDSNGQAKLNINLMPGEYIITSMYNGFSIANTVKVNA